MDPVPVSHSHSTKCRLDFFFFSNKIEHFFWKVLDSLKQEKLKYLQMKVIYQELKDVLMDHEIDKIDHVSDKQAVQVLKI